MSTRAGVLSGAIDSLISLTARAEESGAHHSSTGAVLESWARFEEGMITSEEVQRISRDELVAHPA